MKNLSKNPNVVNLLNFYECDKTFHVVLELARGGDVFERLAKRKSYKEIDSRTLAKNLLTAIDYIHSILIY